MGILGKSNGNENATAGSNAAGVQALSNGKAEVTTLGNDLERVRELLFGGQLEEQRAEVEQKVHESADEIRSSVDRKLQAFEATILSKLDKIGSRLETEATQRLSGYNVLEEKVREQKDFLVEKTGEQKELIESTLKGLDERMEKRDETLRSQMLAQGTLFANSIRKHCAELAGLFEREAEAQAKATAERKAVAKVLAALAQKLEGDLGEK